MAKKISANVVISIIVLSPILFLLCVFIITTFRFPLHDLNLWRLSLRYEGIEQFHPKQTELIERKTYIGGPWLTGSRECLYAIGEFRGTRLSDQEILEAYKNLPNFGTKLRPAKFKIYFPRDGEVSIESPIGDWFQEIRQEQPSMQSGDTKYLIYVAQENIFHWGDTRCLEW